MTLVVIEYNMTKSDFSKLSGTPENAMNETINAVKAIRPISFFIYFWHLFVMVVFLTIANIADLSYK